jgi:hypothetical protein
MGLSPSEFLGTPNNPDCLFEQDKWVTTGGAHTAA